MQMQDSRVVLVSSLFLLGLSACSGGDDDDAPDARLQSDANLNLADGPAPDGSSVQSDVPALPADGPAPPDAAACPAPMVLRYTAPGCGAEARPACGSRSQDACASARCGCDGRIVIGCDYFPEPFSHTLPPGSYTHGAPCPTTDGGADSPDGGPRCQCAADEICVVFFGGTCGSPWLSCRKKTAACSAPVCSAGCTEDICRGGRGLDAGGIPSCAAAPCPLTGKYGDALHCYGI